MVSGLGYPPIVTAVMKLSGFGAAEKLRMRSPTLRRVGAELIFVRWSPRRTQSATEAFAITHHSSHLHNVRRQRDGKFKRNNFTDSEFTTERGAHAVLADFAGSAPQFGCQAISKNRQLNTCIKAMPGEFSSPLLRLGCCLCELGNPVAPFQVFPRSSFLLLLAIVLES